MSARRYAREKARQVAHQDLIYRLAREFAQAARDVLETHELDTIVASIESEGLRESLNPDDFCDSNVIYADAFEKILGYEPNVSSQEDSDLWNAAFDLARCNRYWHTPSDDCPDCDEPAKAAGKNGQGCC